MQRQAVPLLVPEAPIVGTGMEHVSAKVVREITGLGLKEAKAVVDGAPIGIDNHTFVYIDWCVGGVSFGKR